MSLVGYDDSSDGESAPPARNEGLKAVDAAPKVLISTSSALIASAQKQNQLSTNLDYETMNRPLLGPQNPFESASLKRKNVLTGFAEEQVFDDATFKMQHRTYDMLGYAQDPSVLGRVEMVGDKDRAEQNRNRDILQVRSSKEANRELRSKRAKKGDASVLDGANAYKGPWANYKDDESQSSSDSSENDEEGEEEEENPVTPEAEEISEPKIVGASETTEFHGTELYDYLGRTYMHVPQDLDISLTKEPGDWECFIPKKKIHTWRGHTGGVTGLKFFPRSGHLLLSAGNDSQIRLWDVYHDRDLLRTYSGHSRAIKDIDFSPDGRQFLSCSYDKGIKLWDTETGQCIERYTTGAVPNCVRFNPMPERSQFFLAGTSDKKIVQFDLRTKEIVQQYDHHLGAVNTITFVDDNHRFMTTSDDKSVRVWDWEINVPIKFLADPYQHSMPAVTLHPSGKYVAAQSMDNRVVAIGANDRFRINRKKNFTGYSCAGYALQLSFSPDGKYLMSGDSQGNACFWDWKTTALRSKFKAHESAVICIAAHPQETSKVATAGLDSRINYWD